ncbi:ead/Ea22-like family protein [Serratia marcescens]|uniref:ead/Ea22-like family protein n=1 Tax=Serratia marcescens TaxID=615 RepID=UPI0007452D06|nr:ead/Ea22-like family protein [Serratia marcescens]MDP8619156.1 ead/Ea22-like family protein [Serratia marcescens]CUY57794.1 Uncharacterised protein [Serratia marcescens]HAT2907008.1 ead/Ea22-like family protein [Serratia marcescens]HAT3742793.1 ead/Ea22-like family protein [Serratia marcescens]HAT3801071.1 ead/Ea22-like family protein [Serratia marcescens]
MDNKLSELKRRAEKCPIRRFKAFIGKANTQATLCADTGIEIIGWSGFDASDLNAKSHRVELARFIAAADPETILALLAELEAKDKRIAELEGSATLLTNQRDLWYGKVQDLEAKLATPVRLKKVDSSNVPYAGDGFNAAVDYCADRVRAAGFTVEGDE